VKEASAEINSRGFQEWLAGQLQLPAATREILTQKCYAGTMGRRSTIPRTAAGQLPPPRSARRDSPREPREGVITSRDNRHLKAFRAALRSSGPATGDPIALEGPRLVEEALRSGLQIESLLVSDSGEASLAKILEAAAHTEHGIHRSKILRTTDKLFSGIAATETPQGIAALVHPREWSFEDILRGPADADGAYRGAPAFVVVMAAIQDPGNVGTIVRSAEAFSATGAVSTRGTADLWSPKALRASAGSALRLPILRGAAIPVLLAQLRVAELKIYAAASRATEAAEKAKKNSPDWNAPTALFIGSEGSGLAPEILHAADAIVSIPVSDEVESLNAGVAASLLLYEAARQRAQSSQP
jgi:RNA methyltransferase, TrmH family